MSKRTIALAVEKISEPVKELSIQEAKRLEQLENVVVENFKTFVQVGQALAEIRERKLYHIKAMTFEKYCKELFDIAKSRARELINATGVVENLRRGGGFGDDHIRRHGGDFDGDQILLPLNERQVRPLTKLRPEQQIAVWKAAIESAPLGKVTASHVKRVVNQYVGEKITTTVRRAQEKVSQKSSAEFAEAFEQFSQQILKERNAHYKNTSRGNIIKALDQLRAELAEDGEFVEDPVFHGGGDDMNKLEKAGFSLFRMDRASMSIKQRSEAGGWQTHDGHYETIKEMEAAFKTVLQDDMHLRG